MPYRDCIFCVTRPCFVLPENGYSKIVDTIEYRTDVNLWRDCEFPSFDASQQIGWIMRDKKGKHILEEW